MTKRISLVLTVLFFACFMCGNSIASDPYLENLNMDLPFDGGSTWNISCGYEESSSGACYTHADGLKDEFALDFNMGQVDCGKSVLAVAGGQVVDVVYSTAPLNYGNRVKISHGNGYYSFYAHLSSIDVEENMNITKGTKIGAVGNSSTTACHLHFVMYKDDIIGDQVPEVSIKPEPMSGYYNFQGGYAEEYTSLNLNNLMTNFDVGKYIDGFVFENVSDLRPDSVNYAISFYENGGQSSLGYPISNVYEWPSINNPYSTTKKVYVQNLEKNGWFPTLVYNEYADNERFGGKGVVFPVHNRIYDYWVDHFWELGAPASNEYFWNGYYTVQWFERSDNEYYAVIYDSNTFTTSHKLKGTPGCPVVAANFFELQSWSNLGCSDINNDG